MHSCVANRYFHIEINLAGENINEFYPFVNIVEIRCHPPVNLLHIIETSFDAVKTAFCQQIPNTPFRIMIAQNLHENYYENEEDSEEENEEDSEEENEKDSEEETINTKKLLNLTNV